MLTNDLMIGSVVTALEMGAFGAIGSAALAIGMIVVAAVAKEISPNVPSSDVSGDIGLL